MRNALGLFLALVGLSGCRSRTGPPLLKKRETRTELSVRGTVDGKLGSVFLKDCVLEKRP